MSDFKKNREDHRLKKSRDRLLSVCNTKIKTTMIGAISDIENMLSDVIQDQPELFEKLRSSILDRGNNQIRNLELEISDYNITYKHNDLHTIILPVKRKE